MAFYHYSGRHNNLSQCAIELVKDSLALHFLAGCLMLVNIMIEQNKVSDIPQVFY